MSQEEKQVAYAPELKLAAVRRVLAGESVGREFGDRRDIPHFLHRYAAKTRPSCLPSRPGFFGRPGFRGTSGRNVECSKAATNSADPSGLPVWVYWRSAAVSIDNSPAARCARHSAIVQRFRQRSISSAVSPPPVPQWAAALDHRQCSGPVTIPARTGFSST
jgi:hypothetical protein